MENKSEMMPWIVHLRWCMTMKLFWDIVFMWADTHLRSWIKVFTLCGLEGNLGRVAKFFPIEALRVMECGFSQSGSFGGAFWNCCNMSDVGQRSNTHWPLVLKRFKHTISWLYVHQLFYQRLESDQLLKTITF